MNYEESVKFLEETEKSGSHYGLDSIIRLLSQLGNPNEALKVIHIAGTNGKGSVSNILSSVLVESGFKVGLFNSPHILSYTECIKLNQNTISKEDFAVCATHTRLACEALVAMNFPHPTAFECLTALTLLYFHTQAVDFAVIEVGLGGAEDATNVFSAPLASIITSISFDHMAFLGDTLTAIATAKSGILKSQSPAILAPNPDEVMQVLFNSCAQLKAPYFFASEPEISIEIHKESLTGMTFSMKTPYFEYQNLETRFIGNHQLINISVALTTLEVLKRHWLYDVPDSAVREGLRNTYWPCRCEYLTHPIPLIIDGAHNDASLTSLIQVLEKYCPTQGVTFLFGVLKDKTVASMLIQLSALTQTIFITEPLSQRALPLSELQLKCEKCFPEVFAIENRERAFDEALLHAKKTNTLLCCVGSLYLSIPLRKYIEKSF